MAVLNNPKQGTPKPVVQETPKQEANSIKASIDPKVLEALPEELRNLVENYTSVSPELAQKIVASVKKLAEQDKEATEAQKWASFNKEAEEQGTKLLVDLASKYGMNLEGRRIIFPFPKGNAGKPDKMMNYLEGSRASSGGTGRKGPKSKGAVVYEGKEYASRLALCKEMNWKYLGRRTSDDAVLEPWDLNGKPLGFKNKLEVKDGKTYLERI